MRKKIAAGNWKMNLTLSEARDLYCGIRYGKKVKGTSIILGTPSVYLKDLATLAKNDSSIAIAAQNVHSQEKGAFTGEISHKMLSSIGVDHVIVGHSERRQIFKESNSIIRDKVNILVDNGFTVIFCCGEPLKERKAKKHKEYVQKQLEQNIYQLDNLDHIVIAYEPIWAIGTGVTASPKEAQEMHAYIRSSIAKRYSKNHSQKISILYGGSVKPDNAKELFSQKDVDGGLVGGASLKTDSFLAISRSF